MKKLQLKAIKKGKMTMFPYQEKIIDLLVSQEKKEILCEMFTNSTLEVRKQIWQFMTDKYPHKLFLFDGLFMQTK